VNYQVNNNAQFLSHLVTHFDNDYRLTLSYKFLLFCALQVKVREATSNDPWGPSSTLMAEIADLTYNVVAFSEIMQMIWKRTNDHGKNWRHVYKALLLLEYLIKTGSEKVAQQCKENIFSIQTLKDFQHLEEGKDQGVHVREKAKQMVTLLKDDERLKAERARALKAKERFARTASGFGSDGSIDGPSNYDRATPVWPESDRRSNPSEMEFVRPQTVGEEELQLQLAIAMSKEEAEQEESKRRSDDVRLQLALSQSEQDFKTKGDKRKPEGGALVDLLDISSAFGATGGVSSPQQSQSASSSDPWGMPVSQPPARAMASNDLWSAKPDPWLPPPSSGNSAFPMSMESTGAIARTKSPNAADGWLNNSAHPPTSNAVPVLPAKPSNDLNDAWSVKTDPWKAPQPTQTQVPDPWKISNDSAPLDPWAPLGDIASGVSDDLSNCAN
jgi:epsin